MFNKKKNLFGFASAIYYIQRRGPSSVKFMVKEFLYIHLAVVLLKRNAIPRFSYNRI